MSTMTIELRSIPGTAAAAGWAGAHTIVVDRPDGKAGGMGLGFNGGELLSLAIGGCFCNDLQYAAHEMALAIDSISISVRIDFGGEPLMATGARMDVKVTSSDADADLAGLIARAKAVSTVSNSLRRGVPVDIVAG